MSREKLHRKIDQVYRHIKKRASERGFGSWSQDLLGAAVKCDDRLDDSPKLTDTEAELVLLGYALGVMHVRHDAELLAKGVQRGRQRRGQETKAAIRDRRDADISKAYDKHIDDGYEPLDAKRKIRAELGHSLKVINTALKKHAR